jgi:hypothetical protein
LKEFISKLTWPAPQFASLDHRVPRIWEEWGRSADHAEPQTIAHSSKTADAHIIGEGLHLTAELHDFSKDDRFCSQSIACANVLETMSGGTPVIPWKSNVAATLTHNFGEKKTWISREGSGATGCTQGCIRTKGVAAYKFARIHIKATPERRHFRPSYSCWE